MQPGLILFAHGARDAAWATPFEAVATLVRARNPAWQVRLAYLEFMTPTLAEAGAALAAAGCTRIEVLLDRLRETHPGVEFRLHAAVGEMPAVHRAMADAVSTVLPREPREPTA